MSGLPIILFWIIFVQEDAAMSFCGFSFGVCVISFVENYFNKSLLIYECVAVISILFLLGMLIDVRRKRAKIHASHND
jgi:multisubunit Na+/H+ antiporter MnhE subunit